MLLQEDTETRKKMLEELLLEHQKLVHELSSMEGKGSDKENEINNQETTAVNWSSSLILLCTKLSHPAMHQRIHGNGTTTVWPWPVPDLPLTFILWRSVQNYEGKVTAVTFAAIVAYGAVLLGMS